MSQNQNNHSLQNKKKSHSNKTLKRVAKWFGVFLFADILCAFYVDSRAHSAVYPLIVAVVFLGVWFFLFSPKGEKYFKQRAVRRRSKSRKRNAHR